MNKRQRKKQLTRARERGAGCMSDFFSRDYALWAYQHRRSELTAASWISTHEVEMRVALLSHPRRRWLTRREYARRKAQIEAEIVARKGAIRAKLETHHYTLAGWVPKQAQ